MIAIEAVRVTVYRSNTSRKKRFSKLSAYKDAAWKAWQAAYYPGCMCRREEPQVDEDDFLCPDCSKKDGYPQAVDLDVAYRRLAILRLTRWLMWRDGSKIPQRLKSDIRNAVSAIGYLDRHPCY